MNQFVEESYETKLDMMSLWHCVFIIQIGVCSVRMILTKGKIKVKESLVLRTVSWKTWVKANARMGTRDIRRHLAAPIQFDQKGMFLLQFTPTALVRAYANTHTHTHTHTHTQRHFVIISFEEFHVYTELDCRLGLECYLSLASNKLHSKQCH